MLRHGNAINLLHVFEVTTITILLLANIIVQKQFAAYVIHVQLVWLDVWSFLCYLVRNFVLFPNNCSSRIKLLQIIDYGVLDVYIGLSEYVCAARAF